MVLNKQKLKAELLTEGENTCLPFDLHIFESVASTNKTLWELLAQEPSCVGDDEFPPIKTTHSDSRYVVIAAEQTAGRGQWGHKWVSSRGGLYLSYGFAPKLDINSGYQLTLASAWGIAEQLRKYGVDVEIKWLNDLVLNGRKLGGILTETKVRTSKITQAVIGVGINWTNPVPSTGVNLDSWNNQGNPSKISCLEKLAAVVLLGIDSGIQCLEQEGVNILLSRYTKLLSNLGDIVNVNDDFSGTVVGVTSTGNLHLRRSTDDTFSVKPSSVFLQPGTISLGYRNSSD
ncbi:biotin--[acetyl-CoA-carboxylase] ligase [Plectonema cf. radiosum LEGE 06105]|uniref:Biotin--[acetyl-CoA-carboxylase] ligase n=1 Tax=Plectonema cf. radiosum LEGE 06105 TaxID=945769 RepID=A0A8J7FD75_9CYAN|nr:biotin--[acetyl-CoA-carboxylase] ligase [Plectonema radiosum]MBE9216394.1 biotin--[acetyl-CoA-carboxylase] ligase [Plectonema cf. radiosum LEGE 06105]